MIIFGTTATRKLLEAGKFQCPNCQTQTAYEKRRAKKWGHLYWIPIIPMDEFPPYVECKKCKNTYVAAVLDQERAAQRFQAEFERAAGLIMAKMILADGKVEAAETEMMRVVFGRITGSSIEREIVENLIAEAQADERSAEQIAAGFSGSLNTQGAELVVRAILQIAVADGDLAREEVDLMARIATTLGLSKAHFRALMDEALSPAESGDADSEHRSQPH